MEEEPEPRQHIILKNLASNINYDHILKIIRGSNGFNIEILVKEIDERYKVLADLVERAVDKLGESSRYREKRIMKLVQSLERRINNQKNGLKPYENLGFYVTQRLYEKGEKYKEIYDILTKELVITKKA